MIKKICTALVAMITSFTLHAQGAFNPTDTVMVVAPIPSSSDWHYGLYAGVGGMFTGSSLSDNFGNCFVFQGGVTGGYQRLVAKTDVAFGQPSIKNANIFAAYDAQGHPTQGNAMPMPLTWAGPCSWATRCSMVTS